MATVDVPPKERAEEKELTILEHLQELRYRLIVCSVALVIGMLASLWPLSGMFIDYLAEPATEYLEGGKLAFFDPLEYWSTYFRVTLLLGIAIAMPVIIYQTLAFVGPGLTPSERRWVFPLVVGASIAFVAGMAFAYYVELPPALRFLIGNTGENTVPLIGVRKYIDFVTRLMFITGVVFEMPLLIMGLAKLGIVRSSKLLGWWRYAIVSAVVVGGVVTPSVDPVTQGLLAGAILALYFVGVVLAKLVEANPIIPR